MHSLRNLGMQLAVLTSSLLLPLFTVCNTTAGLFDVIAEAQFSGGSAARHLGVTRRFGVPDSCDTADTVPAALRRDHTTRDHTLLPSPPKHSTCSSSSSVNSKAAMRQKLMHADAHRGSVSGTATSAEVLILETAPAL
jgi:hypothetical protein